MNNLYTILFSFLLLNCFAQVPVVNSISGPTVVCGSPSSASSFTASATNSPTYYNWGVSPWGATINNGSSSVASISFPNSPGVYTIYCSATNAFGTSSYKYFTVTVFETPVVSFSGDNTFCQGSSTNLSASSTIQGASSTVSYNWAPSFGLNTTIGPNVVANPSVSTTYSVIANNGVCSNTGTLVVAPFETLSVSFSGANTFCQGSSTNLSASSTIQGASSTVFYSWSPSFGLNTIFGPNVIASPSVSTTYTVTSFYGNCSNTGQITVGPNGFSAPNITAQASNSIVCYGDSITLTASGANTYTWSNFVQDGVPFGAYYSNTYYVYGTDLNGCVGTGSTNIVVNPPPYFYVNSTSNPLTVGQTATLTIVGSSGVSYYLNATSTPTMIVASPTSNTNYTFTAINSSGCEYTVTYTLYVLTVGLESINASLSNYLSVYPNPSNGIFSVKSSSKEMIEIINQLGEVVKAIELTANEEQQISNLSAGIYIVKSKNKRVKIIVTR